MARIVEGEPAASDEMRILAGQERSTRGRAHRHRRVIHETHAARRQPVDRRRADLGAEASQIREAEVVEQNADGAANNLSKRLGTAEDPQWARDMFERGRLGAVDSWPAYPLGWTDVSSAPFRLYKATTMNGGIRVRW